VGHPKSDIIKIGVILDAFGLSIQYILVKRKALKTVLITCAKQINSLFRINELLNFKWHGF